MDDRSSPAPSDTLEALEYLRRFINGSYSPAAPEDVARAHAQLALVEESLRSAERCPENNEPCLFECSGGWCRTLFGHTDRELDAFKNAAPQVSLSACHSDAGADHAGSAGPAVAAPYIDRGDAVNLARTLVDAVAGVTLITEEGVRCLASAVLAMDEYIRRNPEQRHSGGVADMPAPSIRDGEAGVALGRPPAYKKVWGIK